MNSKSAITALLTLSLLPISFACAASDYSHVDVIVTARDTGQRLVSGGDETLTDSPQIVEKQNYIFVDPAHTFQTIIGIGGALTDASAETFYKLSAKKQQEILTAYFDPQNGIGYSLGRTSIHSCDFSSGSYTYVKDGDTNLDSFDISHDLKYRIPFIKAALATAGADHFTLFASPWSPPAWMKSNHDMLHGGVLEPEYYDCWARYFCKFIRAYEQQGIRIWGVTVQNEPMAIQTWESCNFTAAQERDFVKNDLGPELRKNGLKKTKVMIWDHNRSFMYEYASTILDDPAAAKYVWGVGYHWYVGDHFENVKQVKDAFPKTHLLFTEGCVSNFDSRLMGNWNWGETYAISMIHDFNNGAEGWTDWNVLLDKNGGPNHVGNFCFAPIHADTDTGTLYYMDSYYYIGQFSKFIRPGAKRIISSSSQDDLLTTAFINPDKSIAVIVLNVSDKPQPFHLWMQEKAADNTSPAHSIMTLVMSP
ncbi:MAG TPA: glycoside hydrolase family 30 protein [Candidatus Acidoferrales bacterium]|jgi:glucosylceramidase|nr:glycoside hydrolase family 30 protein [Candidatus Acidoferrales bacterium]